MSPLSKVFLLSPPSKVDSSVTLAFLLEVKHLTHSSYSELFLLHTLALTRDGKYHVRVQTRNPEHPIAKELAQLPNVTFHVSHIESDQLLREAMQGMDAVFFNANSFAIGEKAETFWSMRAFELANESGVKFFQFSNLDYSLKKAGYDPKFRCAHPDGKGRIGGKLTSPHQSDILELWQ